MTFAKVLVSLDVIAWLATFFVLGGPNASFQVGLLHVVCANVAAVVINVAALAVVIFTS